mmetsp:Transcript_27181/g.48801  ORF Transcript_27181/g.48801 Transcript_27181/m.48801 type:complete len:333 (-) Transcript_27181:441-1439(-)
MDDLTKRQSLQTIPTEPTHTLYSDPAYSPTQHSIESRTYELIGIVSSELVAHSITYKLITEHCAPCRLLSGTPKAQLRVRLRLKNGSKFIMIISFFFNQVAMSFTAEELKAAPGAYDSLSEIVNYLNSNSTIGRYMLNFTGRNCLVVFEDVQDCTNHGDKLGSYLWTWIKLLAKQFESDFSSLLLPCLRRSSDSFSVVSILAETKKVLRDIGFPNFKEKITEDCVEYTFGIIGIEETAVVPVVLLLHSDKILVRVYHTYRLQTPHFETPTLDDLLESYNATSEGRCARHSTKLYTEFVNTRIRLDNWRSNLTSFIKSSVRSFCNSRHKFVKL